MSKLNIDDLISALNEAALVARRISERQHIDNLKNYFKADGTPLTKTFKVGDKDIVIPLYVLADHSSVGLDELEVDFEARLLLDHEDNDSEVKKSLLGKDRYHSIGSIHFDSQNKKDSNLGNAKIKVKFKKDEKPEAVSRLVDDLIQKMEDPSVNKK